MHGQGTSDENSGDIPPTSSKIGSNFMDYLSIAATMESNSLLIVGAGGLGCRWARGPLRISTESDLMLVDADMDSFKGASQAHCVHLDPTGMEKGTAALPALAAHRTIAAIPEIADVLDSAELVIILWAGRWHGNRLDFGTCSYEKKGAIVVVVAGLPFAEQSFRSGWRVMLSQA